MTTGTHRHHQVILTDDDHEILEGLRLVIEADPEISVIGIGFDENYVLDLVQTHRPDMVLMDVEMPKADGIAATRRLEPRYPNLGVIMLTNSRHDTWLKEVLDAGVNGFLTKGTSRADLFVAIKRVAHSGRFMSTKSLNMLIANYEDPSFTPGPRFRAGEKALTATEWQVWQETLKGKNNMQTTKVM